MTDGTGAPTLTLELTRKPDGTVVFRCRRADGSATWQRHDRHAAFFPLHDLTHYAVETVLGLERAFYGLVAEGWDLADFGSPWPRGPLPHDAVAAEVVVGFLDGERASGELWAADELAGRLAGADATAAGEPLRVDAAALDRIRDRRRDLFGRWARTPAGDTLALPFPA